MNPIAFSNESKMLDFKLFLGEKTKKLMNYKLIDTLNS
jgi:hypothetical protein